MLSDAFFCLWTVWFGYVRMMLQGLNWLFWIGFTMKHMFLFLTVFICGSVFGEVQWLRYREFRDSGRFIGGSRWVNVKPAGDKPEGIEAGDFEYDVWYGEHSFSLVEGSRAVFAFTRSRKYGPFDRLYIDSDFDNSLADEDAVEAYSYEHDQSRFGPVGVVFETDDGPVTYHVLISLYTYPEHERVYLRTGCCYEGSVEVGGGERFVRLVDYDCDGRFDGVSMNFSNADRILLDGGEDSAGKSYFVGKYIDIGGRYYHPQPSADGAYIEFGAYDDVPTGELKVRPEVSEVQVGGKNGFLYLRPIEGVCELPVGKWKWSKWEIERNDANDEGVSWVMTGSGFGKNGDIEIAEGQQVEVDVGEPVRSELSVDKKGRRSYVFDQKLKGRLGESIYIRGSRGRVPPKLRIVSRAGEQDYDRSYDFEYG